MQVTLSQQQLAARAPKKHGVWNIHAATPEKWPEHLRLQWEERVSELLSFDHIDEAKHRGIVQQIARHELLLSVMLQKLIESGITIVPDRRRKHQFKPNPLFKPLTTMENTLARLYQLARLTPQQVQVHLHRTFTDDLNDIPDAEDVEESQ